MEDEKQVQGPVENRRHLVDLRRHGEHHVEKVLCIGQIVARIDKGLADRLLVGEGGNGAGLGQEPDDVEVQVLVRLGAGVIGRDRADHRGEDCHWVGTGRVPLEELLHVLVEQSVP
jgi:hypothetical protein